MVSWIRFWPGPASSKPGRGSDFVVRRFLSMLAGAVLLVTACVFIGCGPSVTVGDGSPHMVSCDISSSGDGTEAGQRVLVTFRFDKDVSVDGDVAGDFSVELNGKAIDPEVMAVRAEADGSDALMLSLIPSDKAAARGSKSFACYAGEITVRAAREDGALPHVKAAGGSGAAVMGEDVRGIVPTGVAIELSNAVSGDAAAGVPASCTFKVTHGPVLRCCTWLDLGDGPVCFIHNHQFVRETPESCAEALADAIEAADCGFSATCDGPFVTVVAQEVVDGQVVAPSILEGVGASVDASSVDWDKNI